MIGDIDSFKTLYLTHFRAVVGFCQAYLKDEEEAMDVAQESFYRLYQRRDESYTIQHALAFVYTTAKNQCLDLLRQAKYKKEDIDSLREELLSDDFFLDEIARQELQEQIRQAIDKLTGRSREIAELALAGKSNSEIAEALSISLNTVKSLKKEMYLKLRGSISRDYLVLVYLKNLLKIDL